MYLVIFLCGAMLGSFLLNAPRALFLRGGVELPGDIFKETHPRLRWVAWTFPALTMIIFLPACVGFALFLARHLAERPRVLLFFFPLFACQAATLATCFYEIVARVSPVAYRSGSKYIVHPGAPLCGLARLAVFAAVSLAALCFCFPRDL